MIHTLRENNINTVPEELVSSENTIRYILMICIIAADDGWSIPSTFSPQTFEQLEVVLSESSTLNELVIHKKEINYSSFQKNESRKRKMDS